MSKLWKVISWAGIIVLGLVSGVLEDILFVTILVPYMPPSWDLTGDLFWVFAGRLAQLMTLAVAGTAAWFLGLRHPARLLTFWACWSVARATFLTRINNPPEDVMIYLLWIALWCGLIGLMTWLVGQRSRRSGTKAD